ncbi:MAG TPA: hypothetical protein VMC79_12475 [Rectinemataceae bacterium]|nr:hypothetical protein [Rectinemataceae bacterium]
MIEELIEAAALGRSVYITGLHERFGSLADEASDRIACVVELLDGTGRRRYDLKLPRLDSLTDPERDFVGEYLHAEIYNIISSLGGKHLTLYADPSRSLLAGMLRKLPALFGIGLPRSTRSGYGRAVNVLDRMLAAIYPSDPPFSIRFGDIAEVPASTRSESAALDVIGFFRRQTEGLGGRALLGIDVGGTDIKAVLVDDGQVVDFKEYDWFPAGFRRSRQLIDPIVLVVRLLQARLWLHRAHLEGVRRAELEGRMGRALAKEASDDEMLAFLDGLRAEGLDEGLRLDGIGLCFPDVVVRNKIVGGEVYKTRGIRTNPELDYEADFAELTDLDLRLGSWVKQGGAVRIINDGPMASFTAAVEIAASPAAAEVAKGVFAHTLGTELGTGWVTETGEIPDIPLEVYNFIIDLGSRPERAFEPDDIRSVNNFNTGLPGTLQKYCSQSGVFRLALKYFPTERPDLFRELQEKGFVERRKIGDSSGWYIPTEPVDQRKSFLEHLMKLPDREQDETNFRIWREIGESLAVTLLETRRILGPGSDERFLFGRLVKNRRCFDLMVEGARSVDPGISLVVAGTGIANTPLMKQLERHPEYSVAQFAQAIGAVYFANGGGAARP